MKSIKSRVLIYNLVIEVKIFYCININIIDTLAVIVHSQVAFAFIVVAFAYLGPSLVDQAAFVLALLVDPFAVASLVDPFAVASLVDPLVIASFVGPLVIASFVGPHIPLAVIASLADHHNLKLVPNCLLRPQLLRQLTLRQLLRHTLHYPRQQRLNH